MKTIETVAILSICLGLICCNGPNRSRADSGSSVSRTAQAPQQEAPPDSLDKMAAVFVGAPSRALIKAKMDRALVLYGLPVSEENYNRYGSVLVKMRQESAVGEIEMLRFVISLREEAPDVEMKLTDAIALAATSLELSGR